MEEMHKKLIDDLQQQHQTEVAVLLREKDQLLQEETAATIAGKTNSKMLQVDAMDANFPS